MDLLFRDGNWELEGKNTQRGTSHPCIPVLPCTKLKSGSLCPKWICVQGFLTLGLVEEALRKLMANGNEASRCKYFLLPSLEDNNEDSGWRDGE
jgi:hypothetical protein